MAEGWLLRDRIGIKSPPSIMAASDANMRYKILAMYGCFWRAAVAAIAISLCTLPAGAVVSGRMIQLAQNASEGGGGAIDPSHAPAASAPANSPEQIRKAQVELRRLDCLNGRIDGKLGDQTREAVRKFWASAKQPVVEVDITDELIASLAGHGDNFCRPPRRFFGFGGRTLPPMLAPGARPSSIPPATVHPVSPGAAN
jgi:hypothetical protein